MKSALRFAILVGFIRLAAAQAPALGNCTVFPADNIWNTRIDQLPVHPSSSNWVITIGPSAMVHPDFGSGTYNGGPIGIAYVVVPGTSTKYPATFLYQSESDTGPYAVPLNAPIEGGSGSTGDRHVISADSDNCILYEIYNAFPQSASWKGDSGAIFNLSSNALRPATWTSADAAGLPIFAGLVRYDEIASGEIRHAIRFTAPKTQKAYVWPARHYASSLTGAQYPPMGARFRLKASFDISRFSPTNQMILSALKQYGMILADNGSAWFLSGAPDSRWDNNDLHALTTIAGSNFEAVDVSPLMVTPDSGQARQTSVSVTLAPATASVRLNTQQQFAATVTGNSNQSVTWDVNGTVGGNATAGFIDSITGLYTAPSVVPAGSVIVHATSSAVSWAVGSASVVVTNPAPVAAPSATPASGVAPLTVNFSSAGSNSPAGSIVSYSWNFGDGSALSSSASPSHIYQNSGSYKAVLTVTDNQGATASAQVAIAVTIGALAAPANLAATAGRGSVTLNWTASSTGQSGFYIERKRWGTNSFMRVGMVTATARTFTDTVAKAAYTYRVQAFNATAVSPYSNAVTVRVAH